MQVEGQEITLPPEELLVEARGKSGYALERDRDLAVAVSTALDPELLDEGLVRELIHKVQSLRREKGLEIEEGVRVGLAGSPACPGRCGGAGETTSGARCWRGSWISTGTRSAARA